MISGELWVNVKEDRHINGFSCIQSLFLETKALNLAEIWRDLARCDRVCGYTDYVFFGGIGRGVESECRFAGQDAHFALLRNKFPRKYVANGAIEGYTNSRMGLYRFEALGGVECGIAAMRCRFDRLTAPPSCLAYLGLYVREMYYI